MITITEQQRRNNMENMTTDELIDRIHKWQIEASSGYNDGWTRQHYQEKLDQYEGPYSDGAEVHTQWEKATTEIWGELNSEEYKDDPDDPLNQESSSEWFDTVGDEVLGLSQVHFSDFGEELKSASPEARAYFAERELPPTSSSEESPEGMSDEELDDAMQQATDDYDELRDTPEGQAAYDKLVGLEGEKKRRRSEESITPKGSFRKVQEQWVKNNLKVL